MTSPLREVEMRPAYEWTCDECGRDQFERAIVVTRESLDEEDREAFDILAGDVEGVNALRAPDTVTCKDCGLKFETTYQEDTEPEGS